MLVLQAVCKVGSCARNPATVLEQLCVPLLQCTADSDHERVARSISALALVFKGFNDCAAAHEGLLGILQQISGRVALQWNVPVVLKAVRELCSTAVAVGVEASCELLCPVLANAKGEEDAIRATTALLTF